MPLHGGAPGAFTKCGNKSLSGKISGEGSVCSLTGSTDHVQ